MTKHPNRARFLLPAGYFVVWLLALLFFWCFTGATDGMAYGLLVLWLMLPAATFVFSLLVAKTNCWDRGFWFCLPFCSVLYMLAPYLTFTLANMLSTHRLHAPDWSALLIGAAISLLGLAVGRVLHTFHTQAASHH